jgi:Protein of unknown function (DUF4089)
MPMADEDKSTAELEAWCNAMEQLLALPLDRADAKEVIANLRILARQMELVGDFPLDDREEPAPRFRT